MAVHKQAFTIAGLSIDVFFDPTSIGSPVPVSAFFLLHGRLSSSESIQPIAESLVRLTSKTGDSQSSRQDLIVITFVRLRHNHPSPQSHILDIHRITGTMAHDCQILRRIMVGAKTVKKTMIVTRKHCAEILVLAGIQ